MKALYFESFGGPDVLRYGDQPDPLPAPGRAIVRTRAVGLNFADVYRRKGTYHLAGSPPWILGYEATGVVESVDGEGVRQGDRVGFADSPFSNAELVSVPIEKLIPLPDDVGFDVAAAVLLQGLTAQYLVRDSHALKAGESVLVHAAAGGVGLLLVQIAKLMGARVMGLVSRDEKAQLARAAGADDTALYTEDWVAKARAFGGDGVDVALDSVGQTLKRSLEAVRTGGHVVFYGMAGGDPESIDPRMLMDTSKTLTGGDLWNVLTSRERRTSRAAELLAWVRDGRLKVHVSARFALADGAKAHELLESRESTGKILLLP